MTQIIGIAIISLMLALILKSTNPSFSAILVLCAACILFARVIGSLSDIFDNLLSISSESAEASAYIKLMLKTLGIALITQLIADVCRDSGESALAGQTELAAKIIIIAMIMPLLDAVIKAVSGLLV